MGVKCNLPQEHRLWLFENRVLRKLFGRQGEEITGHWRKVHNKELRGVYSHQLFLGHVIQENETRGAHDAYVGDTYRVSVEKPEEKGPLGSSGSIQEDYIEAYLKEKG